MTESNFFSRKEQSEFIHRVYQETPPKIQDLFRQESELLSRAIKGSATVLEIGCGFGRILHVISPQTRYTGIDIGLNYVLEARSIHDRGDWVCGDATSLPLFKNSFDAVFCIQNTLGNMEGIESRVLTECRRVCRQGGRIIVSVYSEDSFEIRRLWYDRLVDLGIFGRVWLDPANSRMARSDTGWSSRCFDQEEIRMLLTDAASTEIKRLDSFLYFCIAQM